MLAHFPVYRTYGTRRALDVDRTCCSRRPTAAQRPASPTDRWVDRRGSHAPDVAEPPAGRATARFQQLSAPVAAKSVEDTAFYRYGRLLSRNDVGFDVERFG